MTRQPRPMRPGAPDPGRSQRRPASRPSGALGPIARACLSALAAGALTAGCAAEDGPIVGNGSIEAASFAVAAESAGRVSEIRVQPGDRVEAGDPLLMLDPEPLDLALAEARATLRLAELGRDQAAAEPGSSAVERSLALADAEAAVEAARLAQAGLELAREGLTLRAPVAGRILSAPELPGEWVLPGAVLLRLAEAEPLTITIYVAEADLDAVEIGQSAELAVDAYRSEEDKDGDPLTFDAEVIRIAEQAELTPREVQTRDERAHLVFAVTLRVDDPKGRLLPGMPAEVTFER